MASTTGRKTSARTSKSRSAAAKKAAATRKRNEAAKVAAEAPVTSPDITLPYSGPVVEDLGNGQVKVDGIVYHLSSPEPVVPPISPIVRPEPEVETEKTPKRKAKKFLRNLRQMPLRIRFEAQDDKRQATKFEPRGSRGDLTTLREEWQEDPILFANLQAGTIEIITEGEAQDIIRKQWHNASTQELHPARAAIRNEQGQPIPNVEIYDPNVRDIVAAPLQQIDGEGTEQVLFDEYGNIARPQAAPAQDQLYDPYTGLPQTRLPGSAPQQVAAPGGQLAPTPFAEYSNGQTPQDIQDQIAALQDQLARSGATGPGAGVGGLPVVIEPTRRA